MALDHSCQVQRHTNAERGLDLYETPSVAVEALLRVEQLPHCIWEPATGKGAIVRVLRGHGHSVITSDIYDYGGLHFVADFLTQERMPVGCECILTNPPFQIVEPFVARALELSPLVILLLRLAFLESERRCGILENRGLARVHLFRKRLPMHRDLWVGKKANSGMAFAWMVWIRGHRPAISQPHFLGALNVRGPQSKAQGRSRRTRVGQPAGRARLAVFPRAAVRRRRR